MVLIWLCLFIAFIVIEALTLSLVTVWFAVGAIVALVLALLGLPLWLQITVFILVSVLMLIFMFPFAKKKLGVGRSKTNVDELIGKQVTVIEEIQFNKYGRVSIHGVIWSATSSETIEKDAIVQVLAIEGNKVVVQKVKEEKES